MSLPLEVLPHPLPADRPPWWSVAGTLIAAPVFIGTVVLNVPFWLCGWRLAPPVFGWAGSRWVGVALAALAIPLMLEFVLRFVREGHGTPMPMAPPRRLVVRGPYRFVRNPGYLAALGIVLGQALMFGSLAVLLYAGALALVFHMFVVAYEEPALLRKFGAEYAAYSARVGRWLPRPPRR